MMGWPLQLIQAVQRQQLPQAQTRLRVLIIIVITIGQPLILPDNILGIRRFNSEEGSMGRLFLHWDMYLCILGTKLCKQKCHEFGWTTHNIYHLLMFRATGPAIFGSDLQLKFYLQTKIWLKMGQNWRWI